jgi:hypothetical protein
MPSNPDYCCWLWRRSLGDLYVNDNNRFQLVASLKFKRAIDVLTALQGDETPLKVA